MNEGGSAENILRKASRSSYQPLVFSEEQIREPRKKDGSMGACREVLGAIISTNNDEIVEQIEENGCFNGETSSVACIN